MLEEDSLRSPTRQARKATKARLGVEGYSRFGNADFKKAGRRQIAAALSSNRASRHVAAPSLRHYAALSFVVAGIAQGRRAQGGHVSSEW